MCHVLAGRLSFESLVPHLYPAVGALQAASKAITDALKEETKNISIVVIGAASSGSSAGM